MKTKALYVSAMIFLLTACVGAAPPDPEPAAPKAAKPEPAKMTGHDVMKKNYEQMTTKNFRSDVLMKLMNRGGRVQTRHLKRLSKTDSNDQEKYLLIFTDPPRIRHTALLTVEHKEKDDDVWFYMPAIRKIKRISGSNMRGPYMGTEFTFKDLKREKVTPDRNRYEMIKSEQLDGVDYYVLDAFPACESEMAEQGYKRRRLWVRKDNHLASKIIFYDEDGEYMKTLIGSDMKEIGKSGKFRYCTLTMTNKKGVKTIIQFNMIRINEKDPKDNYFTKAFLTRKK
jgi:hypothetical protein